MSSDCLHPQSAILLNYELVKVGLEMLRETLSLLLEQLLILNELLVKDVLSFLLGLAYMADELLMRLVKELEPWQEVPIELSLIMKFLRHKSGPHMIELVLQELT